MSPLSSPTEPNRGSGICNLSKTHSEVIDSLGIQYSAKRLALHGADFFPSIVGRYLEFVAVKKFGRELGNDDNNNKWAY